MRTIQGKGIDISMSDTTIRIRDAKADDLEAIVSFNEAMALGIDPGSLPAARSVITVTDRQLNNLVDEVWGVLLAQNDPPHLFTSVGQLARLVQRDGGPRIQYIEEAVAYSVLFRACDWMAERGTRTASPP